MVHPMRAAVLLRPLAGVSICIYLATVFFSHPWLHSTYGIETLDCLPSAVSHLVDHTPWGYNSPAVISDFVKASSGAISPAEAFAKALAAPQPHWPNVQAAYSDGNGVGCLLFATVALKLFGFHVSAMVLVFLLLLAISGALLIARFHDMRLLAVPIVFAALTAVMASPLGSAQWGRDQAPLGGVRYFPAAAMLPALHIFFELTEKRWPSSNPSRRRAIALLAVQAVIFGCVVLVRSEASDLAVGIAAVMLVASSKFLRRRDRVALSHLYRKASLTAGCACILLLMAWVFVKATPYDQYPMLGTAWTRAFASFGANPAWPFPGVKKAFPCNEVLPGGMKSGILDIDAGCAYVAWGTERGLTLSEFYTPSDVLDNRYDTVMRDGWFRVVRMDPVDALVTYVYYKPRLILDTMPSPFELSATQPVVIAGVCAEGLLVVFFGLLAALLPPEIVRRARTVTFAVAVLGISSLISYMEAWCTLQTATSLFLWELCGAALALGICSQAFSCRYLAQRLTKPALEPTTTPLPNGNLALTPASQNHDCEQ